MRSTCGYEARRTLRNAWSRALTGPLPSPTAMRRSSPIQAFTVASVSMSGRSASSADGRW
jgi:hypothetical protein